MASASQKYSQLAKITRATMEIVVRYFTIIREITEKRQERIEIREDSTLEDMLAILVRRYGRGFERYASPRRGKKGLQPVFLLNGQDVSQLNGLKTRLRDGDTVAVMPPIAGG